MKLLSNKLLLCLFLFPFGNAALQGNVAEAQHAFIGISEYEKELYLTPAGKYTEDDIIANGRMTRSQKFRDFIPAHNVQLKKGDFFCPITLTKANPKCMWVVGGKSYQFCCPPCIDEFLLLAKEHPENIKDPEEYLK
jgi:hypothetical protein